ncbi:hypothetical protein HK097_011592, partial [Rhizophlyctis rosea]
MELIVRFLFGMWNEPEARERFSTTYPPLSRHQSLEFRTLAVKWLEQLKREGHLQPPDIIIRKSYFDECRGERFERCLLSLSEAVLRRVVESLEIDGGGESIGETGGAVGGGRKGGVDLEVEIGKVRLREFFPLQDKSGLKSNDDLDILSFGTGIRDLRGVRLDVAIRFSRVVNSDFDIFSSVNAAHSFTPDLTKRNTVLFDIQFQALQTQILHQSSLFLSETQSRQSESQKWSKVAASLADEFTDISEKE